MIWILIMERDIEALCMKASASAAATSGKDLRQDFLSIEDDHRYGRIGDPGLGDVRSYQLRGWEMYLILMKYH